MTNGHGSKDADSLSRETVTNTRRVGRHSSVNLVGAGASALSNFALIFVVTTTQDLPTAGAFFAAISVVMVLQTGSRLGADTGLVYWISRRIDSRETGSLLPTLKTGLAAPILASLVLAACLMIWAAPIADIIHPAHTEIVSSQLRLVAMLIPLAVAYDLTLAATRGFESMRPTVVIEKLFRPLAQLSAVTATSLLGYDSWLLGAWAAPFVPSLLWAIVALRRHLVGIQVPDISTVKERQKSNPVAGAFWRFSAPRALTGLIQICMQRLDIVLVASLAGPSAAAIYTAASRFLIVAQLGNQALFVATQPRLARLMSSGSKHLAVDLYRTSTGWLVLLAWPILLASVVFAPTLMSLFGSGYADGAPALRILATAMLVATAVGAVDVVLIMSGRTGWNLANALATLALMAAIDLILIPPFGAVGAAIGWGSALIFGNLSALAIVWTLEKMNPFGHAFRTAALISVVGFAIPGLFLIHLYDSTWWTLTASLVIGIALGGYLVWRSRSVLSLSSLIPKG